MAVAASMATTATSLAFPSPQATKFVVNAQSAVVVSKQAWPIKKMLFSEKNLGKIALTPHSLS